MQKVMDYFEKISCIPRMSGHEQQISGYLVKFAIEHNLEYRRDEFMNVLIKKPGHGNTVILQSHMDMVCVSTAAHDFSRDPIKLIYEDGFVRADGTTLGADDGIGMAMMLALLADDSLPQPTLECVFTSDEEVNLSGAEKFNKRRLNGKLMINLDNDVMNEICVSSAGGITSQLHLPLEFEKLTNDMCYELRIEDLTGGHSGVEIHKSFGNANVILGRILFEANKLFNIQVVELEGGASDSFIANHAFVKLFIKKQDAPSFQKFITEKETLLRNEFIHDEKLRLVLAEQFDNAHDKAISKSCLTKIIFVLLALPNGVLSENPELVQTSNNIGKIEMTNGGEIIFLCLSRSMFESQKYFVADKITLISECVGGIAKRFCNFPGWAYKHDSYLRKIIEQAYKNKSYAPPIIKGIHAGLECAFFDCDDMDIVSIGPNILANHTVNERLDIKSVEDTFTILCEVLKLIAKK